MRKQDNTPAAHAQVSVEILNMAEYFPAAVLETDEQGETSIRLGLGDIRLQARSEGKFVERYCNLAEDGVGAADADCAVTLVLNERCAFWRLCLWLAFCEALRSERSRCPGKCIE